MSERAAAGSTMFVAGNNKKKKKQIKNNVLSFESSGRWTVRHRGGKKTKRRGDLETISGIFFFFFKLFFVVRTI